MYFHVISLDCFKDSHLRPIETTMHITVTEGFMAIILGDLRDSIIPGLSQAFLLPYCHSLSLYGNVEVNIKVGLKYCNLFHIERDLRPFPEIPRNNL